MDDGINLIGVYRGPEESAITVYGTSSAPANTRGHPHQKSPHPKRHSRVGEDATSGEDSPYVPSFRKPRAMQTLTRAETAWSNILFEKMGICREDMDDSDETEEEYTTLQQPKEKSAKMTIIDNTAAMQMVPINEVGDEQAVFLAELTAAKEEAAAVTALLSVSNRQKAMLEEKLRHSEEECQEIRKVLEEKAAALTTAASAQPSVPIKIELLERQVAQLQASGERAEAERGALAAQNDKLRDEVCRLESQLVVSKALAAAATQYSDADNNIKQLEKVQSEVLRLKKELVGSHSAAQNAIDAAKVAESRASDAVCREQAAQTELSTVQKAKEIAERGCNDAIHSREQLKVESTQLRTEMTDLQMEITRLHDDISRLQDASASASAAHGAEITGLEMKLETTESDLQSVRESYHQAEHAQTQLAEQISVLKTQITELSSSNAQIDLEKQTAQDRAMNAERREHDALEMVSAVQEAKQAAENAYQNALQTVDQLRNEATKLHDEMSDLKTEIIAAKEGIFELQGAAAETAAVHEGDVAKLKGLVRTAEAKLHATEHELHTARQNYQAAVQAQEQLLEEITCLKEQVTELATENTDIDADREAAEKRAGDAEHRECKALGSAFAAEQAQAAAEKAYAHALQTVDNLRMESAKLHTKVAKLQTNVTELDEEISDLHSAATETAVVHDAEVDTLRSSLSTVQNNLQSSESQLGLLRESYLPSQHVEAKLSEEIAALRGEVASTGAAHAASLAAKKAAESQLKAAEEHVAELKGQLCMYEQEIEALKTNVGSLTTQLMVAQDATSAKEVQLENEKAAAHSTIETLQKERYEEVETLKNQLQVAQKQLESKTSEHSFVQNKLTAQARIAADAALQHAAALLEAQKQIQEAEANCAAARQQAATVAAAIPLPPQTPRESTLLENPSLPQSTHVSMWSRLVERKRSVDQPSYALRDLEAGFEHGMDVDSHDHDGDERGPFAAFVLRLGAWESALRVAKAGDIAVAVVRRKAHQHQKAIVLLGVTYLVLLHIGLVTQRLWAI